MSNIMKVITRSALALIVVVFVASFLTSGNANMPLLEPAPSLDPIPETTPSTTPARVLSQVPTPTEVVPSTTAPPKPVPSLVNPLPETGDPITKNKKVTVHPKPPKRQVSETYELYPNTEGNHTP